MAAQDHVHIVREVFAAWNAHDAEGFLKRLDTKTVWESDVFPAPFAGHEGARQFFKLYVAAFPDLHLDIEQILAAGDSHVPSAGARPERTSGPWALPRRRDERRSIT